MKNIFDVTYIVCAPLFAFPNPPIEQKGCVKQNCPKCGDKMWVSQKKLELMKTYQKEKLHYVILCAICAVSETDGVEVEVVDIDKKQ